ncbi:hypothetical protein [Asanoa siamensis]|uniref:Uncharacterized protein n=1 Tax=Asanoa siamensis TaxID=926357 RepID=A0ABQ4CJR2_9ACTN|nr:hypothetical protein [Asanoa siamensis]GIF71213.1 hypothetical protein Asi02nite_07310 [Asanoa siamensis]
MSERDWFATQVAQATLDLARVGKALVAEERLGNTTAAVRDDFVLLLRARAREVEAVAGTGWAGLERVRRDRVAPVLAAALAVLEGIQLRGHPFFRPTRIAAETLLDALVDAGGIGRTVLLSVGDSDRFERLAGLVRTRFPDAGVWGLPILVHELGHLVADALPAPGDKDARPVLFHLDRSDDPLLGELFADVFATYALGPAYPVAVMTLRARPDRFDDATATHPSWDRRVWTMVAALRAQADLAADPLTAAGHRRAADEVARRWKALNPVTTEPPKRAEEDARGLVELLDHNAPARLGFDPLIGLAPLVDALDRGQPPAGDPVAIVAAAWRWRLAHPDGPVARVDTIALRALAGGADA